MSEQARFSFSRKDVAFEISGSEQFVADQLAIFKDALLAELSSDDSDELDSGAGDQNAPPAAPLQTAPDRTSTNLYPNVLHIETDKVRILKRVPGTNTAKKAVATAMIYIWAKRNSGVDAVSAGEIRDACKDQACFDSPNFMSSIKGAREWIIVDGIKNSSAQTCKLTLPGVTQAEKLLAELNAS